ncbi:MAG: magnesium/cobalt transporter CorA [Alkalispirochaetaceae bacterium]
MAKLLHALRVRRESLGQPPGSLSVEESGEPSVLDVITYDESSFSESRIEMPPGSALPELPPEPEGGVRWINVTGVQDGGLLQEIGHRFSVHPLMLEDVQHTDQRPKLQDSGESLFLVVRMISWNQEDRLMETEQVSIFARGSTVISFQEHPGDVFDGIRERIRHWKGRIRSRRSDYLVYAILDAIVDSVFIVVDQLQEMVEETEEQILDDPTDSALPGAHGIRRDVITIRRAIWPLREMLQLPTKGQNEFFRDETAPFIQDTYDHVLALVDTIDGQRDRVTGLFQLHASVVASSTNEVMRTLTIIATIFIPLTFLVGIYGMNFSHMPELDWPYGYPTILGVMALVAGGMIYYFRRRRWF